MKDKHLEQLDNELTADDFERLFQEYLDESLDSEDSLDEPKDLDDNTKRKDWTRS